MGASDVDSLEYLEYDRDDEITTLVQSYNKMVSDLSDSTRKLAQAERDKAWSGMARQVAHEIKNPLTPMKLQLQRLIRLKQKGDPHWQDIFDEVAKVVLDHIDILSETANEFSTFAKLYTEEPTSMDLDLVLREEIAMFDNRENIQINYMGLKDAVATGPKPQLTRVFVNLINNAIQVVEEQGGGTIQISLRNSSSGDGFYDIVFEDSGPGVASENVDKLFTPNFTTKSSGTGLGLAISRSILERCGARISYSRSFVLGGACFTIVYPK
jgi:nitrogen fixation/metabolism regulation signal transduction histidine kinase